MQAAPAGARRRPAGANALARHGALRDARAAALHRQGPVAGGRLRRRDPQVQDDRGGGHPEGGLRHTPARAGRHARGRDRRGRHAGPYRASSVHQRDVGPTLLFFGLGLMCA